MMSKNYQIQGYQLWPNYFSLEENLKIKSQKIIQTIIDTKIDFFNRNKHIIDLQKLELYLDPDRDIYYQPKNHQPSYCRAGLHYSIPDDTVGIGLKVDPFYENEDQWAILYHGTKTKNILNIIQNGLKPGERQAYKGSLDPYGQSIPNGVYFSFWVNQSFQYTDRQNPIIFQCFVKDVFVAKNFKGYTVSNNSMLSRILIPLKKDRSNQLI